MAEKAKTKSALQRRIDAGKADPITDREREQLDELRATYARRFGREAERRLMESIRGGATA